MKFEKVVEKQKSIAYNKHIFERKVKTMFYILKTDLTNDYSVNYGVFDNEQQAKDFVNAQKQYDDVIYEIKPVENVYQEHGF